VRIARCYKEEGDVGKEVNHLQAALGAEPGNHGVRTLLAMELLGNGETDRALELLTWQGLNEFKRTRIPR